MLLTRTSCTKGLGMPCAEAGDGAPASPAARTKAAIRRNGAQFCIGTPLSIGADVRVYRPLARRKFRELRRSPSPYIDENGQIVSADLGWLTPVFPGSLRVDGERVHRICQFRGQRRINHTVALDPALPFE